MLVSARVTQGAAEHSLARASSRVSIQPPPRTRRGCSHECATRAAAPVSMATNGSFSQRCSTPASTPISRGPNWRRVANKNPHSWPSSSCSGQLAARQRLAAGQLQSVVTAAAAVTPTGSWPRPYGSSPHRPNVPSWPLEHQAAEPFASAIDDARLAAGGTDIRYWQQVRPGRSQEHWLSDHIGQRDAASSRIVSGRSGGRRGPYLPQRGR